MPAVGGGSYYLGRPLRRAVLARARAGEHIPIKFTGILAGGIVPEALALACIAWLNEPRLLDCLRPSGPPGLAADKLDAALRRHDTSLYEAKRDAHLRDDAGLERTISRLLTDRGTVTVELVERILCHTRLGFDVFRTDRDLRRCYWATSANAIKTRRTVALQKSMAASYPARGAVLPTSQTDRATSRPSATGRKPVKITPEATTRVAERDTQDTFLNVRVDAGMLADFDRLVAALGLTRSQYVRRVISDAVVMGNAGASTVRQAA